MSRVRVVVFGAAGQGRECLDALEAMRAQGESLRVVGVVDDSPSVANLKRLMDRRTPYLGNTLDWLADRDGVEHYVLGIGDPMVRARLSETLNSHGLTPFNVIHPTATIGTECSFGDGVVIRARAVIGTNVHLGDHVHINAGATVGHDSVFGDFVTINPAAAVAGDVRLHDLVMIGTTATVLQGLCVGAKSIIGAAALVTREVPEGVVVMGVPGRWK